MPSLQPDPDAASLARAPAALAARLASAYPEAAARPADIRVVFAPGRVNLIGEHTDYNEGFVLPVAIDLGIAIALLPTGDGIARLTLAETGRTGEFQAAAPGERQNAWIDYVAGMGWGLPGAGVATVGFPGGRAL